MPLLWNKRGLCTYTYILALCWHCMRCWTPLVWNGSLTNSYHICTSCFIWHVTFDNNLVLYSINVIYFNLTNVMFIFYSSYMIDVLCCVHLTFYMVSSIVIYYCIFLAMVPHVFFCFLIKVWNWIGLNIFYSSKKHGKSLIRIKKKVWITSKSYIYSNPGDDTLCTAGIAAQNRWIWLY